MKKAILGKKVGMTTIFDDNSNAIPVTVILAGPCHVTQKKTLEKDGYEAVQLGFDDKKTKLVTKPEKGHFEKSGVTPKKFVREFKLDDAANYEEGQEVSVSIFEAGDKVDITGISKGKGFAGAVKRHNFNRGPMGHGSMYHRRPGSGGATDPARVFKGSRMPGHMGHERVTAQNLEIAKILPEEHLILIKGAVPGPKKGYVMIKSTVKSSKK